jgi:peroxiredoxin (alkyl hydroperoxide reductase subunit C)
MLKRLNYCAGFIGAAVCIFMLLAPSASSAQVLGSCGTTSEDEPAAVEPAAGLVNQPMPLPGRHAINFELPAVVGDEIKTIKLSDYNGKWRILCFYPADFTFV